MSSSRHALRVLAGLAVAAFGVLFLAYFGSGILFDPPDSRTHVDAEPEAADVKQDPRVDPSRRKMGDRSVYRDAVGYHKRGGARVTGFVKGGSGEPIHDAFIALCSNSHVRETRTNSEGRFIIDICPLGRSVIYAFHKDHGVASIEFGMASCRDYGIDLILAAEHSIRGRACEVDGVGISGATVSLLVPGARNASPWPVCSTDVTGAFSFFGFDQECRVLLKGAGYTDARATVVAGEFASIVLDSAKSASTLTIRGPGENKRLYVDVSSQYPDWRIPSGLLETLRQGVVESRNGRVELQGVPRGKWSVCAVSSKGCSKKVDVDLPLTTELGLTIERSPTATIDVCDDRGFPVANAEMGSVIVDVSESLEPHRIWRMWDEAAVLHVRTDARGRANIPVHHNQLAWVGVQAPGFTSVARVVKGSAARRFKVVLKPAGELRVVRSSDIKLVRRSLILEAIDKKSGDSDVRIQIWPLGYTRKYDEYILAAGDYRGRIEYHCTARERTPAGVPASIAVKSSSIRDIRITPGKVTTWDLDTKDEWRIQIEAVGSDGAVVEWSSRASDDNPRERLQGWVVCDQHGCARIAVTGLSRVELRVWSKREGESRTLAVSRPRNEEALVQVRAELSTGQISIVHR